ncbi:MAG: glycosyltransferase family 4 protein [Candidatus Krumholzibacteria bacterium]|nr:glycosyltransferase family 4 protein [Candidatus Krumholzibacteria bacterium]
MKIGAILPHTLVFGGVRRYVELGNCFVARGHRFSIYTPQGEASAWLPFAGETLTFNALANSANDVLICGSPELLALLDGTAARIRIFYIQLERVEGEDRIIRSGMHRIMVNSSGLARRVRRRYGVEPIDGIGGVNPELFHPVPHESSGPFRVLCYGRLSKPRKGARFVVEAVRSLRRKGFNVELDLFDTLNPGSVDPRVGFDPGVPYRYYLNLPQERMAGMYGSADAFVAAEHRAGWSNTAAEAAACGVPLVCTRSGTEDFAEDGVTALLLRSRMAFFIERAVKRLYLDRSLGARLGEAGRRRILDFTWSEVCGRMERTFLGLLKDEGRDGA